MIKDMMYHRRLGDETDDLHFTAAVRTGQWIDFPYTRLRGHKPF